MSLEPPLIAKSVPARLTSELEHVRVLFVFMLVEFRLSRKCFLATFALHLARGGGRVGLAFQLVFIFVARKFERLPAVDAAGGLVVVDHVRVSLECEPVGQYLVTDLTFCRAMAHVEMDRSVVDPTAGQPFE